jgi:prepilin-type N-terminal cleavage/methylation domain-containing protein/prepilin-type processing-associated H-X9-DG protein
MKSKGPPSRRLAFTLVELLVVLAILAIVVVIPCLGAATTRERINRMVCLNNLRQMGVGSQMYAAEDSKGRLAGGVSSTGEPPGDDLNWLYGYGPSPSRFVHDHKSFICPSTQNMIRTNLLTTSPYTGLTGLRDLQDNGFNVSSFGHSYEVRSYWLGSGTYIDKTLQTTATFQKTLEPLAGARPGPSMIVLIYDAMDVSVPGMLNDYPSAYAGHGIEGGNMLFCDSHAEWVESRNWGYRWAVSHDTTFAP